jgi:hypothetical protein
MKIQLNHSEPILAAAAAVILALLLPAPATQAQTVTFDFDTSPSPPSVYSSLPVNQTVGGVTANFTGDFSFQTDGTTFLHLSQFSGKYLDPKSLSTRALDIQFDQQLIGISVTYATIDYQDNREIPSDIKLTAYEVGTVTNLVGTAITHAAYAGDTYPMGTLSFSSGHLFNRVEILVPYQASSLMLFMADNITVTLVPSLTLSMTATNTAVVSWPAPSTDFVLQDNSACRTSNWANVTNDVNTANGQKQVVIQAPTGNRFYRLAHP